MTGYFELSQVGVKCLYVEYDSLEILEMVLSVLVFWHR